MFRITSEGRMGPAGGAQARHRVGALVTLAVPHLNMLAALTTRGSAKVGGSSFLNGSDSSVAGWNCPPKGSNLPGLSLPDTTKLNYAGCHGCIAGNPPVSQNSSAGADSTYFNYGPGLDWNALTAAASKTISGGSTMSTIGPSVSAGSCNTASSTNWGDPLHTDPTMLPCQSYFPIIYAAGNLQLTGGVGQGILLVNGDLTVTGGFQFFGPVIVKGNLATSGTGGHFNGGVMAANVDLQQNTILGNAVIQFSSCAISKAINGSATPMFAVSRYWTELY
jgi:hypothetical protein